MSKLFCFALLLASVSVADAMGTFPRGASQWQPFHVSGGAFKAGYGPDGTAVVTRDGYFPGLGGSNEAKTGRELPKGAGAIAGLCFIETAGGKLGSKSGYVPMEGVAVTIRHDRETQEVKSGTDGFFVTALPPGEYEVEALGIKRHVTIEKGKTSLVAIRGGKSMRD